MKKILFLSLFISFKICGQTPKIEAVVGANENGEAIVGTVKKIDPTDYYYGIKGSNLSTNSNGGGVLGTHAGSGHGVYGSSVLGTGVIGFSPNRGVSGLSNGNGGIGGFFNSLYGNALITDIGNVGLGTFTPTKAFLVVDKKIGAVHAIFGENTSGVAIESNWPGISFNGYYNGSRKPLSNGFVGGMAMNPGTGFISIYNTTASGTAGNNVSTQDVISMDNFGKVGIGNSSPQAKLHLSQGNLRVDNLAGSGNVQVYADNLGTISAALPIAFSVKSNTALIPIATITTTTFPFNTENYDEGGFFNNATYEFNAPVHGIYHFDSAVSFGIVNSANNLAIYNMSFVVDGGTGDAESTQDLKVGGYKTLNLSKDYKLNAGQKVKISVYQSSGATLNLLGQSNSYFTGHLVTRL